MAQVQAIRQATRVQQVSQACLVARLPSERRKAMLLMLPSLVLIEDAVLRAWIVPRWLEAGLFFASLLCWITLTALWRQSFLPAFERAERLATILLAFAALSGVFSVSR
jgi:hypothetical protein